MSRLVLLAIATLGLASAAAGQVVDSAVPIPMRDGVVLRAFVLRPAPTGRFPVLVYRTPYGARAAMRDHATARRAVERGYAVVVQDVRGRYRSDGEFAPYAQEGKDGYDTIEWAAAQPWSNGAVGTFGLSYPGAVQWLAAVESPPHLKAMVPAMTFSRPTNFWSAGGLPDLSWPAWIWLNIAPDIRRRKGLPGPTTGGQARASWARVGDSIVARLPITAVPELAEVAPWYLDWLSHPPDDPWWSWADLTTRYGRTTAAVLNLSGWHDDNYGPEGAITNHTGLIAARRGAPDPASYLLIGPWVHGSGIDDSSATASVGERAVGPAAGLDYDGEILRFMDRYLRSRGDPDRAPPRVRVFLMGENRWLTGESWPLPGTAIRTMQLGRPAAGRGVLGNAPGGTGAWTIVSDPRRPVVDEYPGEPGAHDYRSLAERDDVMVFETEPLEAPLRVVGSIVATLWASSDAPDFDLWVKLFDVAPDGTAWNLMSSGLDVIRVGTRPGATPLVPGEPVEVVLDNLVTANRFAAGHRIRAVVTTSFMPGFSRNLQTGRRETDGAETRTARVTLHFGPGHPSRIAFPVIP